MTIKPYFPAEELVDGIPNWDMSADYLELYAYFSKSSYAPFSTLTNALEVATEKDREDVDGDTFFDNFTSETREVIKERALALGDAYPFEMIDNGNTLRYVKTDLQDSTMPKVFGQAAYVISLVLSNRSPMSNILDVPNAVLEETEVNEIRSYFQYFATSAMAGEIVGRAWSFGFPRLDGSGFQKKLREVWGELDDGTVNPHPGAPKHAKDGGVDVFAARLHRDGRPGFLLAAAQVATGGNWKEKDILGKMNNEFKMTWFSRQPATKFICYHIIPFTCSDKDKYSLYCSRFGNILHRLRLPYRVMEACRLRDEKDISIEAFEELDKAVEWVQEYRSRG